MKNLVKKSNDINLTGNVKIRGQKVQKIHAWCLLGCSIGDFGTILIFSINKFIIFQLFK